MNTNGLTKTTKNVNIQYLRGLAIIAVVIIHSNMPDGLRVAIRPFVNYAVALSQPRILCKLFTKPPR